MLYWQFDKGRKVDRYLLLLRDDVMCLKKKHMKLLKVLERLSYKPLQCK